MTNLKNAIWDQNSHGKYLVCPHCGESDQNGEKQSFTHVKLFEHETLIKGLDDQGNILVMPYENSQTAAGMTYIKCFSCGSNFSSEKAKILIDQEEFENAYGQYEEIYTNQEIDAYCYDYLEEYQQHLEDKEYNLYLKNNK